MHITQRNNGRNDKECNQHQRKHLETKAAIGPANIAHKGQRHTRGDKPSKACEETRERHQLFTLAFIQRNSWHQRPEWNIHNGVGHSP